MQKRSNINNLLHNVSQYIKARGHAESDKRGAASLSTIIVELEDITSETNMTLKILNDLFFCLK